MPSDDTRRGFQVGNVTLGSYDELMVAEKFVSTRWHCGPSRFAGVTTSASTPNELAPPHSRSRESAVPAPSARLFASSSGLQCTAVEATNDFRTPGPRRFGAVRGLGTPEKPALSKRSLSACYRALSPRRDTTRPARRFDGSFCLRGCTHIARRGTFTSTPSPRSAARCTLHTDIPSAPREELATLCFATRNGLGARPTGPPSHPRELALQRRPWKSVCAGNEMAGGRR